MHFCVLGNTREYHNFTIIIFVINVVFQSLRISVTSSLEGIQAFEKNRSMLNFRLLPQAQRVAMGCGSVFTNGNR